LERVKGLRSVSRVEMEACEFDERLDCEVRCGEALEMPHRSILEGDRLLPLALVPEKARAQAIEVRLLQRVRRLGEVERGPEEGLLGSNEICLQPIGVGEGSPGPRLSLIDEDAPRPIENSQDRERELRELLPLGPPVQAALDQEPYPPCLTSAGAVRSATSSPMRRRR
jgi:hypothetical protein